MTLPLFANLQHTVALFVIGGLFSAFFEGLELATNTGMLGRSYQMWMDIDPHLILFTLLPALLTGDAMTLDTSVARRVAKQCIYLASVGVIVNAVLVGLFLEWYMTDVAGYDWSFLLSLTTGAILCATDPVAVVALLKELGASPTLTVLIEGESLLNDGTALVLYEIAYDMLKGLNYDMADIVMYVVKKAMCAFLLGMMIGGVFLAWIYLAHNRFEHHNNVIQISLTLCCAYWSFIIAEGVFHISGVLATVSSALVLAHAMWPNVIDKESMHTFWHMLEYLGNTIIFVLAGALVGKVMVHMSIADYVHLFVIYAVVLVIRFVFMVASRPLLRRLSEDGDDLSIPEVMVMTWGGLRGAVGLALAIQVTVDRADGQLSNKEADRVLFFVGGIAALTLVINATTCPRVVNSLGVTQLPTTKRRLLFMLRRRLLEVCHDTEYPPAAKRALKDMLDELEEQIKAEKQMMMAGAKSKGGLFAAAGSASRAVDHQRSSSKEAAGKTTSEYGEGPSAAMSSRHSFGNRIGKWLGSHRPDVGCGYSYEAFVEELAQVKQTFKEIPAENLEILQAASSCILQLSEGETRDREAQFLDILKTEAPEPAFLRAINEAFLHIVRSLYWEEMDHGDLKPGSFEADVLLSSLVHAMERAESELKDWQYVHPCVATMTSDISEDFVHKASVKSQDILRSTLEVLEDRRSLNCPHSVTSTLSVFKRDPMKPEEVSPGCNKVMNRWQLRKHKFYGNKERGQTCLTAFVDSRFFQGLILITILMNSTIIFIEEDYRNESNDGHWFWLVSDVLFNAIFTIEAVLKIVTTGYKYFTESWNLFDFLLVVSGNVGTVFNLMTSASSDTTENASVLRIARVFRVLRLVRLARLLKYVQTGIDYFSAADAVSKEIREHVQKMTILTVFVRSHMTAQKHIIDYFGTTAYKACSVEIAHCVLQSEISVYQAIFRAVAEELALAPQLLKEVQEMRECIMISTELEQFILGAHSAGIIGASDTRSIIHPLRVYMTKTCQENVRQTWREHTSSNSKELKSSNSGTLTGTLTQACLSRISDDDDEEVMSSNLSATTTSMPRVSADSIQPHVADASQTMAPSMSSGSRTAQGSISSTEVVDSAFESVIPGAVSDYERPRTAD
jgi:NhaP-type Na+/H+ or K+/H+ antiporter